MDFYFRGARCFFLFPFLLFSIKKFTIMAGWFYIRRRVKATRRRHLHFFSVQPQPIWQCLEENTQSGVRLFFVFAFLQIPLPGGRRRNGEDDNKAAGGGGGGRSSSLVPRCCG